MSATKLEKVYFWMIAICGFILVNLSPALSAPDEHAHYINAYCTSRFDFIAELNESKTSLGKYVPRYILSFVGNNRDNFAGNLDGKYSFKTQYFAVWLRVNDADRELVFYDSSLTSLNSGAYIVAGLGMRIG